MSLHVGPAVADGFASAGPAPFTPREWQVLQVYARTGATKATGSELGITASCVKSHLNRAYMKLDAENAIDAFHRLGWLRVPGDPS